MPEDAFLSSAAALYDISVKDLRSAVEGMGKEGLHWRPEARDTNTAAILTAHAMGSARDWICIAVAAERRPRKRADEFLTTFESQAQALILLDEIAKDTRQVLRAAGTINWAEVVPNVGQAGDPPSTRAYCLLHALQHLREHVAHVQLTRQLWDAR